MDSVLKFIKNQKMLMVFLLLFILSSIVSPLFFTFVNLTNLLMQISVYGVISCGLIFVIINGDFDISVGAVMTLSSLLSVIIINVIGIIPALLIMIAMGFVIGLINGLLVSKLKIHSFVVTLAGMAFYRGIAFIVSDGNSVICKNTMFNEISNGKLLGIPNLILIFLLLIVVAEFVLKKTTYGRNVCAVGGNKEVAMYTGVKVTFNKTSTFVLSGIAACLAGFLLASRLNTGTPNYGEDAALYVIAAIVLGGTSLNGGRGGAVKTLIGLLILGLVTNALNMMNVFSYYQLAIRGLLLILIIAVDRFYQNRRS